MNFKSNLLSIISSILLCATFSYLANIRRVYLNLVQAFKENDSEALTKSFEYLKSHYKFIGIFTLSIMILYGLILVFAILGSLFAR